MSGSTIVKEWENRQKQGRYTTYVESMAGLAKLIDDRIAALTPMALPAAVYQEESANTSYCDDTADNYRARQQELRDAGFTPYTCDELDEFPKW